MLILTRSVDETVVIGDEVTVTILRVKGNQVRLGVNAPKTISVQREEVFHRIKQERTEGTETAQHRDRISRVAAPRRRPR